MEFLVKEFCFGKFLSIRTNNVAMLAELKSVLVQKCFCDIKQSIICPTCSNIGFLVIEQKFALSIVSIALSSNLRVYSFMQGRLLCECYEELAYPILSIESPS